MKTYRTMEQQTRRAAYICLGIAFVCIALVFSSCGQIFKGDRGIQGPAGSNGSNGLSVVSLSMAAPVGSCTNGGSVLLTAQDSDKTGVWAANDANQTSTLVCNGLNGATGQTGATGSQGASGMNGTNATPITIVQLCAGVVPSYPSTFPEVALCISNQLYGVYSSNGGFLSLLTPGTYSSDGINASCTLTVAANCVVTH